MARVIVSRQWSEGDSLQISIDVAASYPDALAEAKRTALDTFTEALATTPAAEAPDEQP